MTSSSFSNNSISPLSPVKMLFSVLEGIMWIYGNHLLRRDGLYMILLLLWIPTPTPRPSCSIKNSRDNKVFYYVKWHNKKTNKWYQSLRWLKRRSDDKKNRGTPLVPARCRRAAAASTSRKTDGKAMERVGL